MRAFAEIKTAIDLRLDDEAAIGAGEEHDHADRNRPGAEPADRDAGHHHHPFQRVRLMQPLAVLGDESRLGRFDVAHLPHPHLRSRSSVLITDTIAS